MQYGQLLRDNASVITMNPVDKAYLLLDMTEPPAWKDDPISYYDPKQLETAIQIIVLHYRYSHFSPKFEQRSLVQWFNQIDNQKLQAMLRGQ
jgi:hypothetical protein